MLGDVRSTQRPIDVNMSSGKVDVYFRNAGSKPPVSIEYKSNSSSSSSSVDQSSSSSFPIDYSTSLPSWSSSSLSSSSPPSTSSLSSSSISSCLASSASSSLLLKLPATLAHRQDYLKTKQLSLQQEMRVDNILMDTSNKVVVDHFNIEMTTVQIQCLKNTVWLNDEVINFYMQILQQRSNQYRCFFNNTFFYAKLIQGGCYKYKNVARWSRRVGIKILEMDMVFAPIYVHENHWCLACINLVSHRFEYYDSYGGTNVDCRYVRDEAELYSHTTVDLSTWGNYTPRTIPQQTNGCDCGVFACKYADYISDNCPLVFSQVDMPYFRRRMLLEIIQKRYLD